VNKLTLGAILFTLTVVSAAAQTSTLQCNVSVPVQPTLRAEGYSERTGDIILACLGGTPTAANVIVPVVDITVAVNAPVANRVAQGGNSDVVLIVDEPGSGIAGTSNTQQFCPSVLNTCEILGTGTGAGTYDGSSGRPNMFRGVATGTTVTFHAIPIDAPANGFIRTLRIVNLRVNASALGAGGASAPVIATINVQPSQGFAISIGGNNLATAGSVTSGIAFSVRTPDNSGTGSGTNINQCSSPQRAAVIRFAEKFQTAVLTRTTAAFVNGETSPPAAIQNVPGAIYKSETGFYSPAFIGPPPFDTAFFSATSLSDAGTRFRASISNLPAGATVFVSARNVLFSGPTPSAATSGTVARLVQNETAAFAPAAVTTSLENIPVVQLNVQNGSAAAVWEALAADPSTVENFDFLVWVLPSTTGGSGVVNLSLAPAPPAFTSSAGGAVSMTVPVPHFISDPNPARSLFSTSGCVVNAPTTTLLFAGVTSALAPATLTATVTATGGSVPVGTVTFSDGGAVIPNSATTLNNRGIATFTASFGAGQHNFTAMFTPTTNGFLASTSAVSSVNVPKIASNLFLTSSSSPVAPGQSVTFTATINVPLGTPGGTVQFNDGIQSIAGVVFNGSVARVSTTFRTAGTHDISATYGGDTNFNGSSAHFTQVVSRITPTLAISTSTAAADFGQPVKLTATLSVAPPAGVASPTGNMLFFDGDSQIGSFGVSGNAAAMTVSNLAPGGHQFSATYSGDSNWNSVHSAIATTTVGKGPANISLAISASSTQTTFLATVSAPGISFVPTGNVQFTDLNTGTSLGSNSLGSGQASMTLTAANLAGLAGHGVIAVYTGDANFVSATSNTVNLAVLANTAGGASQNFAADEIATFYGAGLAADTAQAPSGDPPTVLSDATVTVIDSIGGVRPAGLLYASPTQLNFVMPSTVMSGPATVTLKRGDTVVYSVQTQVALVAPGIFTFSNGGVAGQAIRVRADGSQSVEDIASGIDLATDSVYLVIYCTGVRGRSDLSKVTTIIGGQTVPALYAGQQGGFAGLDQINVLLPAGLRGSGVVNLSVTVDGSVSNSATLTFK
jgi:uncharacterized protein (TIGR03437 family)